MRRRRMNCRIDRAFLVGVVLDGVVAGVREGIGMLGKVPTLGAVQ